MKSLRQKVFSALSIASIIISGGAISNAQAGVIGVTVDPSDNSVVGATEFRAALGGDAIRYFIPLSDGSGVYGVDDSGDFGLSADSGNGGGVLSMYLLFDPITTGQSYFLNIVFEDLDLSGANDPFGFFESVEVLSADGLTSLSGGVITPIGGLITGDAVTQQLLSLYLGPVLSDPFLIRLDFAASYYRNIWNTPEFLIAELSEVPLPGALWLFLAGIGGLAHAKRRAA